MIGHKVLLKVYRKKRNQKNNMRKSKIIHGVLLVSLLCFLLCKNGFTQDKLNTLKLQIGTEKDTFLVSESIWLDLYLINTNQDSTNVKPLSPGSGWLKIVVIDNADGDTILPYAEEAIDYMGSGPSYTIAPDDTLYICRDLLESTGFGEMETQAMFWRSYLKPGRYTIKTIYEKTLESNMISVLIENPTGVEQEAYELWRKGCTNLKGDSSIAAWKDLLDRYPRSVYAPSVCFELSNIYSVVKSDVETSESYRKELLSMYPNSGYSQYSFGPFVKNKTEKERNQIFKELESKYAGTRAGKFAKNSRNKIIAY
jgi:hypothetical protein